MSTRGAPAAAASGDRGACARRRCDATMASKLLSWLPDAAEIRADLAYVPPAEFDYVGMDKPWRNMTMHYYSLDEVARFNGYE